MRRIFPFIFILGCGLFLAGYYVPTQKPGVCSVLIPYNSTNQCQLYATIGNVLGFIGALAATLTLVLALSLLGLRRASKNDDKT